MKNLTIETATQLLNDNMQNQNLRRHCYGVGKALRAYREYYSAQGRDVGSLTADQWEITGILHDADYEITQNNWEQHTLLLLDWLKDYETPEEMLNVFRSHNNKITHLRKPETLLEWTLECCDELTGFIVAVALVTPSRKLADVTVERVLKKFKQKEFARAVERDQITQCKEKVGVGIEDFVSVCLMAMKENANLLGL